MRESNIEKETLVMALNACHVSELPDPLDGKETRVWVRGLAKVTKCNNSHSYVTVENDSKGNPFITRDFGDSATIVSIDCVYPTVFLENEDMPSVRSLNDIVKYLTVHGEDKAEMDSLANSKNKKDKEKLKDLVYRYTIQDMNRTK